MSTYLDKLEVFGIKLGLSQIVELLERLGRPDRKLKIIHVAGTNGKGSVCAMVERVLREAGFKVGFYSSPHLVRLNERFKINGENISDSQLKRAIQKVKHHSDLMIKAGKTPTFFEFTTALALDWFADKKCDVVLLEVGMGGRLDATNAVMPILCGITRIGLDHQQHLGTTLSQIAAEKAGIIKPGVPVVVGQQEPKAMEVLRFIADSQKSPLIEAVDAQAKESLAMNNGHQEVLLFGHFYELSLAGVWQVENAVLAYKMLECLATILKFDFKKYLSAWTDVRWPGRFQLVDWRTVLDGAHNPDGAEALVKAWNYRFGSEKATILFANFSDKATHDILKIILPIAKKFIFVPIRGAKGRPSMSPPELTALLHSMDPTIPSLECNTVSEGATSLKEHDGYQIVTGSLFLLGEYMKYEHIDP